VRTHSLTLAPYRIAPAQLITAPSYLIDRFVPACEIIHLPEKELAGGTLEIAVGPTTSTPEPKGRKANLVDQLGLRRKRPRSVPGLFCDLRHHTPQNWAHFLNNHLPLVFVGCAQMGLSWTEVTLILPADTPDYITGAAALFGMSVHTTDDPVTGEALLLDMAPWTGLRPARADWVKSPEIAACLARLPTDTALPSQVFLTRRDTRTLANSAEVEAWLTARGFTTLLAEDLSPGDQMRLFHEAHQIVAIHGAALAPLLYRRPGRHLTALVELLPCGHMTDVYRVMAQQVGVPWIGVRGRIKPEYIAPAHDFTKRFDQFSLDTFDVDIASLELAFAHLPHQPAKGS